MSLKGITVLELTHAVAGPYCTMMLGDLGANVIKVEPPTGDEGRHVRTPLTQGDGPYFKAVNRNKRSIVIDLQSEAGRETFLVLCRKADVLVHNYRPGVVERLGIDYQQVCAVNPKIVYCCISAFGQEGPYRTRIGFDGVVQALAGMTAITGEPAGLPMRSPVPMVDMGTAYSATMGVLFALYTRERDGAGRYLDFSLLRTALSLEAIYFTYCEETGGDLPRFGNESHVTITNTMPTAEGTLMFSVSFDHHWNRFCRLVGLTDMIDNPKFSISAQRLRNKDEIYSRLGPIFLTRTAAEWEELLVAAGLPAARLREWSEVTHDPQALHEQLFFRVPYAQTDVLNVASPLGPKLSPVHRGIPQLGEHTSEILAEFGFSPEQVRTLTESGVTSPREHGSSR